MVDLVVDHLDAKRPVSTEADVPPGKTASDGRLFFTGTSPFFKIQEIQVCAPSCGIF